MIDLTERQRRQIEILADESRKWNCYTFARYWLNNHDTDSLELGVLISEGLVEELPLENEPDHKQIRATQKGRELVGSVAKD